MKTSLAGLGLVVMGCAAQPGDGTTQPVATAPPAPPAGNVDACAAVPLTGTVLRAQALTPAYFDAPVDMAVDASGNALHALSPSVIGTPVSSTPRGLTKLAPDGTVLLQRQFGDAVASDAAGNIYVAGIFFGAEDFGFGVVTPDNQSPSTYVVKLAGDGTAQWAKEIGPCGVLSVTGLAVAADGRIAVSGDRLGTFMLDADGNEVWSRPLSGDVAFDSRGDLVITGQRAGDWVTAKLDASGAETWAVTVADPQGAPNYPQIGRNVAIDANDNILVSGTSDWHGADMFGHIWVNGTQAGDFVDMTFVVKLASDGTLDWFVNTGTETATGLAVDPLGNALFSGSWHTGLWPSYHKPGLLKLAASDGDVIWGDLAVPASGVGSAWGVATDRCGVAYWTVTARDQPDPNAPYDNYVLTVAM